MEKQRVISHPDQEFEENDYDPDDKFLEEFFHDEEN